MKTPINARLIAALTQRPSRLAIALALGVLLATGPAIPPAPAALAAPAQRAPVCQLKPTRIGWVCMCRGPYGWRTAPRLLCSAAQP